VELLEEAADLFDRARRKDPTYATAVTNLSCVADLLGEFEEAVVLAGKAVRIATKSGEQFSLAGAFAIRGIARFHVDPEDMERARQDLELSGERLPGLAAANLAVLSGVAVPEISASAGPADEVEQIAGFGRLNFDELIDMPAIAEVPRESRDRPAIDIFRSEGEGWRSLVIESRYITVSIVTAEPGYRGETERGIKIGSTLDEVTKAYGAASRTLSIVHTYSIQ
jgi:tetratricopeptide (TPR) repeat protein